MEIQPIVLPSVANLAFPGEMQSVILDLVYFFLCCSSLKYFSSHFLTSF